MLIHPGSPLYATLLSKRLGPCHWHSALYHTLPLLVCILLWIHILKHPMQAPQVQILFELNLVKKENWAHTPGRYQEYLTVSAYPGNWLVYHCHSAAYAHYVHPGRAKISSLWVHHDNVHTQGSTCILIQVQWALCSGLFTLLRTVNSTDCRSKNHVVHHS